MPCLLFLSNLMASLQLLKASSCPKFIQHGFHPSITSLINPSPRKTYPMYFFYLSWVILFNSSKLLPALRSSSTYFLVLPLALHQSFTTQNISYLLFYGVPRAGSFYSNPLVVKLLHSSCVFSSVFLNIFLHTHISKPCSNNNYYNNYMYSFTYLRPPPVLQTSPH